MRICVMSRARAEEQSTLDFAEDKIIISISTPGDDPANIADNPTIKDVLRLSFYDEEEFNPRLGTQLNSPYEHYYSDIMAKKVHAFVEKWKDSVDVLWVHCDAGVSRSAGVAAGIMKALTNDDTPIFDNWLYSPNMRCYRKTLNAFF